MLQVIGPTVGEAAAVVLVVRVVDDVVLVNGAGGQLSIEGCVV